MLSSNELSYEQEVCNILKETKIHQRLEELKERTKATGHEHGFNVCSDGRVTKVIEGNEGRIDKSEVNKECNYQIDISFHSHPTFYAYPSKGDFISDLYNQIRIASCVYSAKDDKVACYRTSDKLRNKYKPLIKNAYNKVSEIVNKFNDTTDPEERSELYDEYVKAHNHYIDVLIDVANNIASYVYHDLTEKSEDYDKVIEKERKFGNFGDVWIKDCGKI
ncbi:MAG: hypothetical protein GPW18_02120 [Euryarchaeota archaeon]|nr:hypothetical protein [Euryarchaeota archaeon]